MRSLIPVFLLWSGVFTVACSDGDSPIQPRQWAIEALDLEAEVIPSHAIAEDTVRVVVTLTNPGTSGITLRGREACVVSRIGVSRNGEVPVSFMGSGEQPCQDDQVLTIPALASTQVSRPVVVWQEPDENTSPLIDGPPWPTGYVFTVQSELLGKEAQDALTVLDSGLHSGFGEVCEPAPSGADSVAVVLDPDVIQDEWLRVRFEIHNLAVAPFSVQLCSGSIMAVLDRHASDGWLLGEWPFICDGHLSGPFGVPIGECVRGVQYDHNYEPGEYRLRIQTSDGVLTSRSMILN